MGENPITRYLWVIIWVGTIFVLSSVHVVSVLYAVGLTIPTMILGMLLSPLWWLVAARGKGKTWQWYDWCNAATVLMVGLILLGAFIRALVQPTLR